MPRIQDTLALYQDDPMSEEYYCTYMHGDRLIARTHDYGNKYPRRLGVITPDDTIVELLYRKGQKPVRTVRSADPGTYNDLIREFGGRIRPLLS
jgi:hypothetical protein